jgi:hypothetical protein
VVVSAQIMVPHAHLAQMTALVICCSFLGSSIGACIAGEIYTNTFMDHLVKHLGAGMSLETAKSVYKVLPAWGMPDRVAIKFAVSLRSRCGVLTWKLTFDAVH